MTQARQSPNSEPIKMPNFTDATPFDPRPTDDQFIWVDRPQFELQLETSLSGLPGASTFDAEMEAARKGRTKLTLVMQHLGALDSQEEDDGPSIAELREQLKAAQAESEKLRGKISLQDCRAAAQDQELVMSRQRTELAAEEHWAWHDAAHTEAQAQLHRAQADHVSDASIAAQQLEAAAYALDQMQQEVKRLTAEVDELRALDPSMAAQQLNDDARRSAIFEGEHWRALAEESQQENKRLTAEVDELRAVEQARRRERDRPTVFYHGTSLESALAIQRDGFDVGRSGTNAGALLGTGAYITTTLEKAMNYALGTGKNPNPAAGAILKLHINLGKCKEIESSDDPMRTTWLTHGYDSAWARAGVIGIREENCVSDPSRITVVDIILGDTAQAKREGFAVDDGCLVMRRPQRPELQCRQEAADFAMAIALSRDGS